jgi:hypothetical protein
MPLFFYFLYIIWSGMLQLYCAPKKPAYPSRRSSYP